MRFFLSATEKLLTSRRAATKTAIREMHMKLDRFAKSSERFLSLPHCGSATWPLYILPRNSWRLSSAKYCRNKYNEIFVKKSTKANFQKPENIEISTFELIEKKKFAIKMLEDQEFRLIVRKLSINRRINEETEAETRIAQMIKMEKTKLSVLIRASKLWIKKMSYKKKMKKYDKMNAWKIIRSTQSFMY